MHMADALLSPAVGATMWVASVGAIAWCSAKVKKEFDDRRIPLMGVTGAFIFAAQMINFTIPATGSSGHLGGGLLLSILLGPCAAFLTIASVLVVQALFFADGGLLALGCNIFNLGIFPAFIAYPVIYRPIAGVSPGQKRLAAATIIAAIAGLQLGSFAVVLETVFSGISSLPFATFVSLMQPIHLAIGLVEGVVTALVISFIYTARPEIMRNTGNAAFSFKPLVLSFLAAAALIGGIASWYASEQPDGLEWSIKKATGKEELENPKNSVHSILAAVQEKFSFLPDYSFKKPEHKQAAGISTQSSNEAEKETQGSRLGTSLSGLAGGAITLALVLGVGFVLRIRQKTAAQRPHDHEHAHPHEHQHEHPHHHGDMKHSHRHDHEHSHPHPHRHDHSRPHSEDPYPAHAHPVSSGDHSHDHAEHEQDAHEHEH